MDIDQHIESARLHAVPLNVERDAMEGDLLVASLIAQQGVALRAVLADGFAAIAKAIDR